MDSLANYGSDDDCDESTNEKMGMSGPTAKRSRIPPEADANYDEVQMDLSEESNNNNSAEDDDQRGEKLREKKRNHRSPSRDNPQPSKSNESKLNRYKRERSAERDSHRKEDERDRSKKSSDYRSKYESSSERSKYSTSSSSRDEKSSGRSSRDERRRDRRRSSSRERRPSSRERRRSRSKERRRSGSRDRRRSGSKERRRSRSPRRTEYRRRSDSKEKDSRNTTRYGKRFDRTSNKMAQLEKLGIEIKTPDAEFVTPQMLLQRSMDEQVQKVKNSTGIELPKYYNPAAMNPARYADQIQKRRLLWQKKDQPTTNSSTSSTSSTSSIIKQPPTMTTTGKVWEQTTFAQDTDGKVASKFKRLMGIKDNTAATTKDGGKDILKKQEEMFSSMEQQYEVARTATHTMRGVGLGFGTYTNYPR